jgi:hypothetical protein
MLSTSYFNSSVCRMLLGARGEGCEVANLDFPNFAVVYCSDVHRFPQSVNLSICKLLISWARCLRVCLDRGGSEELLLLGTASGFYRQTFLAREVPGPSEFSAGIGPATCPKARGTSRADGFLTRDLRKFFRPLRSRPYTYQKAFSHTDRQV